jgi:hypothetical protein
MPSGTSAEEVIVVFGKDNDFIPSHGVVFAIEASMTANDNDPNMGVLLKDGRETG